VGVKLRVEKFLLSRCQVRAAASSLILALRGLATLCLPVYIEQRDRKARGDAAYRVRKRAGRNPNEHGGERYTIERKSKS